MKILFITSPAKPENAVSPTTSICWVKDRKTRHQVLTQTIHSPVDFGNFSTNLSAIDLCKYNFLLWFSLKKVSGPYINSFANALSGKTHLVFPNLDRGIPNENRRKSDGWRPKRRFTRLSDSESLCCNWYELSGHRSVEERGFMQEYLYLLIASPTLRYLLVPRKKVSESIFWLYSENFLKNLMVFFNLSKTYAKK